MNEDQQLEQWNARRAESGLPPITMEYMRSVIAELKFCAIRAARAKLGLPAPERDTHIER